MLSRVARRSQASLRMSHTSASTTTSPSTFSLQAKLPKLPVPELDKTLSKYLRSVQPFLSESEYDETKKIVENFGQAGGVGQKLQQSLLQRAQTEPISWLAEWWKNWAYMEYRDPVVINVSFYYQFETPSAQVDQLTRAADLTALFMEVKHKIDNETQPIDVIKGTPQDMNPYKNIFSSVRIPAPQRDHLVKYSPEQSKHLIVARKNLFYAVGLYDENGQLHSRAAIKQLLQQVVELADKDAGSQPPIGLLSTQHRDTWAKLRPELLQDPLNKASMAVLDAGTFVLCLDTENPANDEDECNLLLHGGGSKRASANRCFDKSTQVVVFKNGHAGLIGEHSGVDGYPVTVVTDEVLHKELGLWKNGHNEGPSGSAKMSQPRLLKWNASPSINKALEETAVYHDANVANLELTPLIFKTYGSNFAKSVGVSPDGYSQLALQLTYFKMHNSIAPQYESCSTRKYLGGRTEVGRVVSVDSTNWVKAMVDPKVSGEDRYKLFKTACDSHVNYMRDASEGFGCDRHLLGLKLLAQDAGLTHPIWNDKAYKESSWWRLSTSQLPSKYALTGYGPVVPDGYGIYYNIRDSQLAYMISAARANESTNAHKFASSLQNVLLDMHKTFAPFAKKPAAKL